MRVALVYLCAVCTAACGSSEHLPVAVPSRSLGKTSWTRYARLHHRELSPSYKHECWENPSQTTGTYTAVAAKKVRDLRGGFLRQGTKTDLPMRVLLYLPNLIGYFRVVLLAASIYYARTQWKLAGLLYVTSFVLDAADGIAARALNQTSKVGVVLDMVTDRCATAALLVILAGLHPVFAPFFIAMLILDISSHWYHVYRSTSEQSHHKDVGNKPLNPILKVYYSNKPIFLWSCLSAELFYLALFVKANMVGHNELVGWAVMGCMPGWFFKQVSNMAQLASSMVALAVPTGN